MSARIGVAAIGTLIVMCSVASLGAVRPDPAATRVTSAYCLGPDVISDAELDRLKQFVRDTDSLTVAFRNLVHIPPVADAAVRLVTDDSVCVRVVH